MAIASLDSARRFSPRSESVVNRGQATALARSQPQRAYDLALTIPDGWYRCQAMAHIAEYAPDALSEKAFRKAREAAHDSFDTYQQAGVLAYAITAAFGRGRKDLVWSMLKDALALMPSVEPMASRAYALHLLWSTISYHGDGKLRALVLAAVTAHVAPDRSWRARRLYRDITDWFMERDLREAGSFVTTMPPGKARAYLQRRIARSSSTEPAP